MNILNKIESSKEIKSLDIGELTQLCSEIRSYMIECCATNPGHLGASLGAVEIAAAVHYVFDTPKDKLVWDVGHQAYAHKIISGRREAFKNNRKYKGLSGFPKMEESEYDAFGAGHTSTSISAALGIAEGARIKGEDTAVIAVIGDGAMTGGLAFEGLNNAGALKSNLLVILNDNQISIDKNVGAMHNYLLKLSTSRTYNKIRNKIWDRVGNVKVRRLLKKFNLSTKLAFFRSGTIFEGLGFRYFGIVDGNNINEMVAMLTNLKDIKGPKLLHVRTLKGKGYQPAEADQSVWHAPGKFNVSTGERAVKSSSALRYQDIFGETIVELANMNKNIVGITPAMASGCSLTKMMELFPQRTYDVGIAEQHAVTFSAGLAAQGLLPYCNIYSTFMQRAFDSIIHDVALQNLKVIFCIDRGGLVGEDGATHQGAFDLSYFRLIPNITVAAPLNEIELRNMLYSASLPEYGITTIRYPRGSCEGLDWQKEFEFMPIGKAQLLTNGDNVAILSIGTVGNSVIDAVRMVNKEGLTPLHYNMRFLKPLDLDAIKDACSKCSTIITVEDGTILGGLHSAVAEFVAENYPGVRVISLGIPDKFIEQGTVEQLVEECGFDKNKIASKIRENYAKNNLVD